MANLVFFDSSHTYEIDGEEIPSVSELTRFISREIYGDVSQFKLDEAGERGRAVHKALEVLDKYGKAECAKNIIPYINAYLQFRKDHVVEWKYIEKPICSPDKRYAGTLDRYGTVDGILTLLDFKTSGSVNGVKNKRSQNRPVKIPDFSPQYRTMYTAAQNLYRKAMQDPVERILILQLKADGTYKLYELPIEDELADACILLHYRLKKKKRKKKIKEEAPDNG